MNSHSSGRRSRHSRGGPRRRGDRRSRQKGAVAKAPKKTFWKRLAALFGNSKGTKKAATVSRNGSQQSRPARKHEPVEVTSARLYVGNLSFDATESDLFELVNRVGH